MFVVILDGALGRRAVGPFRTFNEAHDHMAAKMASEATGGEMMTHSEVLEVMARPLEVGDRVYVDGGSGPLGPERSYGTITDGPDELGNFDILWDSKNAGSRIGCEAGDGLTRIEEYHRDS